VGVYGLNERPEHIVTVFGSSRPREKEPEYLLAYEVGRELAKAGFVVCNGGYAGIMEATARGAKDAGGKTIGIIAEVFESKKANKWIDTTVAAKTLIDRMMELISRGDAYIVLKGGTGTLLEFAAVWEFKNKTLMSKKPIVLVGDFWAGVVDTLKEELAWEGLEQCTKYVEVVDSAADAVQMITNRLAAAENPKKSSAQGAYSR
jgi:uncharacterized protein (TIGR00725 family)